MFLSILFAIPMSAQTMAKNTPTKNDVPQLTLIAQLNPLPSAAVQMDLADNSAPPPIKPKATELVPNQNPAVTDLPGALTVRTDALLELYRMRKTAVTLCLNLPKKYRNGMPECAQIFKDEIRLQRLAKALKDH
jgi:hypothetical protein